MSMAGIIKYNTGTLSVQVIAVDTNLAEDISSFTTRQFKMKDPGGTLLTKNASFTTDGTDGWLYCSIIDTDWDSSGTWQLQVYLASGSQEISSSVVTFNVGEMLV